MVSPLKWSIWLYELILLNSWLSQGTQGRKGGKGAKADKVPAITVPLPVSITLATVFYFNHNFVIVLGRRWISWWQRPGLSSLSESILRQSRGTVVVHKLMTYKDAGLNPDYTVSPQYFFSLFIVLVNKRQKFQE